RQQLLPTDDEQLRQLSARGRRLQRRARQREQVAAPERRPAHRRGELDRLDRAYPVLRDQELRRPRARERRDVRGAASRQGGTRPAADDQRVSTVGTPTSSP